MIILSKYFANCCLKHLSINNCTFIKKMRYILDRMDKSESPLRCVSLLFYFLHEVDCERIGIVICTDIYEINMILYCIASN